MNYSARRALMKRLQDPFYKQRRLQFEVEPAYKGFLWWKNQIGWRVIVWVVEGWSMSAPMGSVGHLVDYDAADEIFVSKFSAYRWIVENVRDFDDVYHYTERSISL